MDAPIYHRLATGKMNQDLYTMVAQVSSQQMWGARSFNGDGFPTVRAYAGPLPEGRDGVEFSTDVKTYYGAGPSEIQWKHVDGCDPRVCLVNEDFCSIPVVIRKVRYSSLTNIKPRTEWVIG